MNVTIEEISKIKRKLTVELPEEEAQKVRKKHLDAYARKARLKGFRPGKAPRNLVAKVYADELRREVLEELVSENVPGALAEHKLEPIGMPMLEDVDYTEGNPFKFTVSVELKPVFDTPEWQGLELQKLKNAVTEEMVDKKLEELRFSLGTVKKVEEDRPLVKGDLANITYQGFEGDQEIKDMKAGPFNVELGMDRLTAEFEAGLEGMKVGETKDIPVKMPEDLDDKNMAGKDIILRTTVNEIRKRELPALDDEFAKDLGIDGVDTLPALREKVRQDLVRAADEQNDQLFNKQLTAILAKLVDIEAPTAMVEREVANKIEAMRQNFGRQGMDFKKMGFDIGMMRNRFRPQAEGNVRAALVLDQIARDQNIEISPEDIEQEFQEMSVDYGQPVEVLKDYYKTQGMMENLREGLRIGKTLDLIKDKAQIVEVDKIDPARLGQEPAPENPLAEGAAPEAPASDEN